MLLGGGGVSGFCVDKGAEPLDGSDESRGGLSADATCVVPPWLATEGATSLGLTFGFTWATGLSGPAAGLGCNDGTGGPFWAMTVSCGIIAAAV